MEDLIGRFGKMRVNKKYESRDYLDESSSESSDYEYRVKPSHFISSNRNKKRNDEKMFGYYKCENCNRHWQSAYSWQGFGQKCKGCGKNTFAYRQEELLKSKDDKIDKLKPHAKNLCAKCKVVGDCTLKYRYY